MSDPGKSRAGQVLAAKYRLDALLGAGGMGEVYRATNELVGRPVAIKLLRPEHATNEEVVARFMREAVTANLVRHPNVVDVLDVGKDADGTPFIVQELLRGQDLASYVEQRGRLSLEEVVDLLCPVIDAIAEAHQQGVVHRDLKPDNVFLAKDAAGRIVPKLLDFGISKVRSPVGRATDVGVMMGTPAYMPPEQLQGARDADARSDVWALGVMLFELLSGRLPFVATEAPVLFVAIATQDAPKLSDVAPDVSTKASKIVERCLRRKPDERYPSAAELARDLRLMKEGQDIESTGRHSIPPALLGRVPSLVPTPQAPASSGRVATPAAFSATVATAPAAPAASGASAASRPRDIELSGVMMGPSPSAPSRRIASSPSLRDLPGATTSAGPEIAWVTGLCVVVLVVLGALGLLMTIAHRPEGWSVVGRFLPGNTTAILAGQVLIALAAAVFGGRYGREAFRAWTDAGGGGRGLAFRHAALSGALLFAAIELVRAAW